MADHKVIDYSKIAEFLKENPDAPFSEFQDKCPVDITDVTYYKYRKLSRAGKWNWVTPMSKTERVQTKRLARDLFKKPGKKPEKDHDKIVAYIQANPDATYEEFRKDTTFKLSSGHYYKVRKQQTGRTSKYSPRKSLYMSLFRHPTASMSQESKDLLKSFVDTLNGSKRAKLEIVEYVSPAMLEVREVR